MKRNRTERRMTGGCPPGWRMFDAPGPVSPLSIPPALRRLFHLKMFPAMIDRRVL